jgi:hypothetical protein
MGALGASILLVPPSCLFELNFNHQVGACILRYLGGGHRRFCFFSLVTRLMGVLGGGILLEPQLSWRPFGGGWLMLKEQE